MVIKIERNTHGEVIVKGTTVIRPIKSRSVESHILLEVLTELVRTNNLLERIRTDLEFINR